MEIQTVCLLPSCRVAISSQVPCRESETLGAEIEVPIRTGQPELVAGRGRVSRRGVDRLV